MKIAIYYPEIRVGGPAAWSGHVAAGMRALGHECDLVAFTHTGKPRRWWGRGDVSRLVKHSNGFPHGLHWWPQGMDRVGKNREAHLVLDEYDLVIIPEPKDSAADRNAVNDCKNPRYIEILDRTKTPWTTALHGPQYQPEKAPYVNMLFERASGFTGVLATPNMMYCQTRPDVFDDRWTYVERPLPFVATRSSDEAPKPRSLTVGMTGRVVANKGQHLMAHLCARMPDGWTTEIHGGCSLGNGPNFTYNVWEHMTEFMGWSGEREGPQDRKPDGTMITVLAPHEWWVEDGLGHRCAYMGNYDDAVARCERLGVHVNLTANRFSNGLVEFVTLEAMDAGCVPVIPEHIHYGSGQFHVFDRIDHAPTLKMLHPDREPNQEQEADIDDFVDTIHDACRTFGNAKAYRDLVAHNREVLVSEHDPAAWCQALIEACL